VSSPNPLQGGSGQIDDLAVWSRALAPAEVLRVFTEGIHESDSDLALYYDFNEGTGAYARNKGRAGAGGQYDLVLGRSDIGGPTDYGVPNKYGGTDRMAFTQPVWALEALPASSPGFDGRCVATLLSGKPQPTGYGGQLFITLKESSSIQFILEYFHPAGLQSTVSITRLPMHGMLEQMICIGGNCTRTPIASVPFEISSSAYASLVYSPEVDFASGDALWYAVSTQGNEATSPSKFEFKFLSVDAVPRASKTDATVVEDSSNGTRILLNGSDSDSKFLTFVITELPRKGKLYSVTGEPLEIAFSAFEVRAFAPRRVWLLHGLSERNSCSGSIADSAHVRLHSQKRKFLLASRPVPESQGDGVPIYHANELER
jgi:hypothetical protein